MEAMQMRCRIRLQPAHHPAALEGRSVTPSCARGSRIAVPEADIQAGGTGVVSGSAGSCMPGLALQQRHKCRYLTPRCLQHLKQAYPTLQSPDIIWFFVVVCLATAPCCNPDIQNVMYVIAERYYICRCSESQSYRERTQEGYACVERSMAEGIKQRAGHCHRGHAMHMLKSLKTHEAQLLTASTIVARLDGTKRLMLRNRARPGRCEKATLSKERALLPKGARLFHELICNHLQGAL
eukprot:365535-Chlamydomonas_euryale.AAC.59